MGVTPGASEPSTSKTEGITLVPGRPFVGPYRLCVELASGGMATVFLAQAPGRAGRHSYVALKRIHPHLAKDRTFVDMFLDEARIASLIQHTHVCSVFDFGEDGGQQYLAMEYLIGEPLSNLGRALRRGTPTSASLHALAMARIIADAAEGLHAAHELRDPHGDPLGVVHRDVSPDNIFLTYDGVVKIVDFGVASATRQLHKTRTGIIKGKYAYLQPEVLRGEKPDRRADVWSLAVVLWELLTLKRLFHRETDFLTLRAIADAEVRAPSQVRAGVPAELDRIVMRALSRDPSERYPSARALADALTAFIAQRREVMGFAQLAELMDRAFAGQHTKRLGFMEWVAAHCPASVDPEADRQATQLLQRPPSERPAPESPLTMRSPTSWTTHSSHGLRPLPLPSFPLTPAGQSPVAYEVPVSKPDRSIFSVIRRWPSRTRTTAAALTSAVVAAAVMAFMLPRNSPAEDRAANAKSAPETPREPASQPIKAPSPPPDSNRVSVGQSARSAAPANEPVGQPARSAAPANEQSTNLEQPRADKPRDEAGAVPIELTGGDYVVELGARADQSRGLVLRIVPKKRPSLPQVEPPPSPAPLPSPPTPEPGSSEKPYQFMPTMP